VSKILVQCYYAWPLQVSLVKSKLDPFEDVLHDTNDGCEDNGVLALIDRALLGVTM